MFEVLRYWIQLIHFLPSFEELSGFMEWCYPLRQKIIPVESGTETDRTAVSHFYQMTHNIFTDSNTTEYILPRPLTRS